jgi:hypothetical protein
MSFLVMFRVMSRMMYYRMMPVMMDRTMMHGMVHRMVFLSIRARCKRDHTDKCQGDQQDFLHVLMFI